MDAQSHRIPKHEACILQFFIAVLASASLLTTCCASPLPLNTLYYSKHGSGTAGTNSTPLVPVHSQEEDPVNFTPLGLRGLGLGLKKLSSAWDGMSLIGFAYTEAIIGKEYENKPIRLSSLTLPARRPTHPSIEYLYLLPKLGLESQNPKDACWSCPVYASKSMMKKNMPQMIYEAHGEPPVYTTTSESESDSPAPPYTATTDDISPPAMSKRDTDRNRIIFFKEHDTVVMRLPRKEFTQSWGLKGECHRTHKDLPKTAADQWNTWIDRILGWPSFLDLVD
ncbi:hypothetical protein F5876DRAFT_74595 [Lentinula aff. lateritia]|uniref:Uncharacterized protein n=1 Tax=Lentinula aff. lateritia TaxID=2804960 RepID=A0ACC1U7D1_9AGAR|nr:hypothetical protein F5876DRAFT_74595 [Lentinula aff. lateritia]